MFTDGGGIGLGGGAQNERLVSLPTSFQAIYDGPATIELQSFSAFPICFDALNFQTRLGGKEGVGVRQRWGLN